MQVLAVVRHKPEVRKISFVAHSLGGLVARFAVGKLYGHSPDDGHAAVSRIGSNEEHVNDSMQSLEHPFKARIAGLEPMNFITFATPHLGSKGNKQVDIAWLYLSSIIKFLRLPFLFLLH